MALFLFGISMGEVVLLFLIVLMLFGSKKIPDLARTFGKGINEFRRAADDIKREFEESADVIRQDLSDLETSIKKESREIAAAANNEVTETDHYDLDNPEVSDESMPDAEIDEGDTGLNESSDDGDSDKKQRPI